MADLPVLEERLGPHPATRQTVKANLESVIIDRALLPLFREHVDRVNRVVEATYLFLKYIGLRTPDMNLDALINEAFVLEVMLSLTTYTPVAS
ncbi:hypothetical protein DFQ29_003890, partial [Apophysomyces sp. BC1021]